MDFQNTQTDEEEQPQEEEQQPPQKRLDARPKNNLYMDGTGPRTGRTAVRTGTINRDGSTSPVSAMGAATGPLSQPLPRFSADQLQQMKDTNSQGFGTRPGRIDARPRNNMYMPGTGPGTGRTAIRVGTINRDGSTSPVSGLGAATGPLSQPTSRFMTPRPTPADAFAQRQGNVANAKANGTFDAARQKFNAANPGHVMDSNGAISKKPAGAGAAGAGAAGAGAAGAAAAGAAAAGAAAAGAAAGNNANGQSKPASSNSGPDAGAAASMHDASGSSISSSAAGLWQSGSPNTRSISSNYGTASSTIKPMTPASTTPATPSSTTPASTAPAISSSNSGPDAGAAASMHDASGSSISSSAAGYWQSGSPNTRSISSNYGTGSSTIKPTTPASTTPATPAAESSPESEEPEENNEGGDEEDNETPAPRAKGGPVKAGKPYLVGEKGPEIIVPKHSGTVVPNHALKTARQTKGLFMQPRPVPAAFFQQMARKLRGHGR